MEAAAVALSSRRIAQHVIEDNTFISEFYTWWIRWQVVKMMVPVYTGLQCMRDIVLDILQVLAVAIVDIDAYLDCGTFPAEIRDMDLSGFQSRNLEHRIRSRKSILKALEKLDPGYVRKIEKDIADVKGKYLPL